MADVAVDPRGQLAYVAHWGEEDCAAVAESGGVNDPDAGAWVVDLRDPAVPKEGVHPALAGQPPRRGDAVLAVSTRHFTGDMLVMNNEQCGKNGKGGVSLYDVRDPAKPKKLSEHFGDRGFADTNDTHSAFAWDAGDRAYVA